MQEKRVRFGDFIKKIRLNDPRELRQAEVAEKLGISLGYYGDIENRRKRPFEPTKIKIFAELFKLSAEDTARLYDLASHENHETPADIEDILMYSSIGEMARYALRQSKEGNITEEAWKTFIRKSEESKLQQGESESNVEDENKQG